MHRRSDATARPTTSRTVALLAILAVAGYGTAQSGAGKPIDLVELIGTPGASGYEEAVRELVIGSLPGWASPRVDSSGNVLLTIGEGAPHLLIVATLDEPAYVISDIDASGYLRLHRQTPMIGPLFDQFFYGQPVAVQTATGALVPGVSATVSTHISRDGPPQGAGGIKTLNGLVIDLGAESRDQVARLGVRLMDPVALRERAQALAGGRVSGVAAQARAGAAALQLLVAWLDAPPAVDGTLTLAWTAEGISRYRGLGRLARDLVPDRAIVVANGQPAGQHEPRGQSGTLGGGVLVAQDDAWIQAAGTAAEVALQQIAPSELLPPTGATRSWEGTSIHLVSVPVRYLATPVEIVSGHDVDALAALLAAAAGIPGPRATAATAMSHTLPPTEPDLELDGSLRSLERLIESYGPSGHEEPVRQAVLEMLPEWAEPRIDGAGNVLVTIGSGEPHFVFVAHMDEGGYEVTEIADDGTLLLRRLGGFIEALYEASPANVHTDTGPVAGVFAPRAGYLEATSLNPPRETGIRVDVGAESRTATASLGVRVGDAVTVRKRLVALAGSRATGPSIDDRVGSTALLLMLQQLDPGAFTDRRLTVAWSTEEEVGLVGARAIAESTRPDIVFAVDTFVSSDSPVDWQRRARIPLGSGVVARVLDGNHVSPRATVDRVLAIAARHGIPITPGSTGGGTDVGAFVEWGSIPMPISWPARYSHSPVELMDQRDLDWLVELLLALATEY